MSTTTATRHTKQARKPVERRLRWLPADKSAAPMPDLVPMADLVKIDDGRGDVCNYTVQEIDAFPGERAFAIGKLDIDDAATYHIRLTRPGTAQCDCPGGTYKRKCKHADAVLKLIELGKLAGPTQRQPQPSDFEFDNA